jgi:hypothetical protein
MDAPPSTTNTETLTGEALEAEFRSVLAALGIQPPDDLAGAVLANSMQPWTKLERVGRGDPIQETVRDEKLTCPTRRAVT